MTRKEFCEIMAAGHEEAADILAPKSVKPEFFALCKQERALARAFRDLAKEQE